MKLINIIQENSLYQLLEARENMAEEKTFSTKKVKIPNRGFTSFAGIFRLGETVASSRILAVGEYYSIKPKKGELNQILVYYDKKKSEESGVFTLSCNSNVLEMEKENARIYVTSPENNTIDQGSILGYDGLKQIIEIESDIRHEIEEDRSSFIQYVVNITFYDLEAVIEKMDKREEMLEQLQKIIKDLCKAIKKADIEKISLYLDQLDNIDWKIYKDTSVGEEENEEDSYERKFYRSACFYTLVATMKIFETKKNIRDIKIIEYTGGKEKHVQIFFAGVSLLI